MIFGAQLSLGGPCYGFADLRAVWAEGFDTRPSGGVPVEARSQSQRISLGVMRAF